MTMKINLCSLLGHLLLLLCLFDLSSGECDSDCNGHGYCTELFEINGCVCNEFWKGEECTERWRHDRNWHNTFLIYRALGIAFFAFFTLVSFYEMIQFIRITKREGRRIFTVVSCVIFGCLLTSIVRLVFFAIDPHGEQGIFNLVAEGFLNLGGTLILADTVSLLLFFWIELQIKSGVSVLANIKKLRPVWIVFAIISAIITVPLYLWKSATLDPLSALLFVIVIVVIALVQICITLVFGTKLLKAVKMVYLSSHDPGYLDYLAKMTQAMIGLVFCLLIVVFIAPGYLVISPWNQTEWYPWVYLAFLAVSRISEIGVIAAMLWMVSKSSKTRYGGKDSSGTSRTDPHTKRSDSSKGRSEIIEVEENSMSSMEMQKYED